MFKRAVIALVLAGMVLLGVGQVAAQGYPNRPIKLVVTYPPGASFDIISRILAEKWTQLLGQPVVVENRLGAGGMIAMQSVARAAPDGYTLVTFNTDLAGIVPALYQFKAYDPLKDFAYIGTLMRGTGFIVAVNPKLPVRNIDELGKFAKSAPDGINYGTYGVGSLPHLGFEALNAKLGTKMVHVPYKGGMPSYQAAIVGEVQVVAGTSFIDMLKSGQ
ncbi:MAG: tripartite tricarboxylate transporter substrate binding protein, partial [Proteobacteria bacterium]|nr:tripartite tricarboxylate transporter substrate binding protein [Pseudomonadota bacterium]